jgi:glycosyltransferase 2 family protein
MSRHPRGARLALTALQLSATFGLLSWALTRADLALFARARLAPGWLALALLCTALAFGAAALRWTFTARRLGLALSLRRALPEVYLASFLNCVLPSGIAGDVLRAARQDAAPAQRTRAFLGVALERLSGQLVLWIALLLSLLGWPALEHRLTWLAPALLLLALGAALLRARRLRSFAPEGPSEDGLAPAIWRALIADGALAVQLATSLLVLGACALGFACTARGLALPLSWPELARIVPPLLALSALPISIGGFGVREAASAALYAESGLDATGGIAVAALYGFLNLLGSAPGALYVWLQREPGRAS